MDITIATLLILSGIVVGVINSFAGAGASITIALYSMLGLDLPVANATNRISVLFQCSTMALGYYKQDKLDLKLGLRLSVPTVLGAIVGSNVVSYINDTIFALFLSTILVAMLILLVCNPMRLLKPVACPKEPTLVHYLLLILVGFYGGSFHIGISYLFIALFMVGLGYDLFETNALKGVVIFIYTLFSLAIFAYNGEINWGFGLMHSVGNAIGAYFATRYSSYIPMKVLRIALMIFISLTIFYILFFKI